MLHMQQNESLLNCPLFFGFTNEEIKQLLKMLEAKKIPCGTEKIIMHEGDSNPYIFIVLSGEAYGVKYTSSGKETIYTRLSAGSVFGDVLAASSNKVSPVTMRTYPKTVLIKFRIDKLVCDNGKNTNLRIKLLKNLAAELAEKLFDLQERLNCLVSPSLRGKIITYLYNEAKKQNSCNITVPLNRERLAAYLNTDRSALSRELSHMKKDGIINFHKNKFILK